MSNSSSIRHFLLLALADTRHLQLLHFCLLLGISLAALLGNTLIISTVACGHHLHTPMFFFLLNLALSDLGSICTTVPKAMHNSLCDTRTISYKGCAAQLFLLYFFISAEYFLLTIMCYDCYVFICKALHYGTLLGSRACAHMAAAAWIFRAVLRIPSEQGWHKAFSPCLPHLAVVSVFFSTVIFAHLKPPSISSPSLDLALFSSQIHTLIQLAVICKFVKGGLDPLTQIISEDIKQDWAQHRSLGDSTSDWTPAGCSTIPTTLWAQPPASS
ncbi:olfactory receptor 10A4-like [Passer domesticus]|uniref:olfactory receptor 10A4-like n=1 Tax=Passer domesticus TaxID=48849 RepID=UPI0030FF2852